MKGFEKFLLIGSLVFGLGLGCGDSVTGDPAVLEEINWVEVPEPDFSTRPLATTALNSEVFVDVVRAKALIDGGALVLDTRNEEAFGEGHIPGALNAQWSIFKASNTDEAYAESDPSIVEATARTIGLSHSNPVLVYGDAISTSSTRQAWQLEFYGHSQVYVLDGGFDAWTGAGEDTSTEAVAATEGDFEVRWRPEVYVSGKDIQEALVDPAKTVVFFDARSFPEYEGDDDRGNPRAGHIPGAVHYEWTNVFSEDGTLRSKEDIRAELQTAGILQDNALIIPYCQGGFRSSVAYAILRWLGQDDVRNYDGSWYEYARLNDLPVE